MDNSSTSTSTSARAARPVTAKDVAERAGVARPTVSTVLNGAKSNTLVAQATRERILQAAQELGYRPNLSAQAIKLRRSGQVGVLFENANWHNGHPLAHDFLLGINAGLEAGGFIMVLLRVTDLANGDGLGARALSGHLLDGVIALNLLPTEIQAQLESRYPCTIWLDSNVWRDERCLRRDERDAGRHVVRALVEAGYRSLLVVHDLPPTDEAATHVTDRNGRTLHFSFAERVAGAREAAREAGVALQEFPLNGRSLSDRFTELRPLLRADVGLIVPETYMSNELLALLARFGPRAGTDFSFVSCDDTFGAAIFHRQEVARISFNRLEMGRQAAQMMIQLLEYGAAACPSHLVTGEFVPGFSCASAP